MLLHRHFSCPLQLSGGLSERHLSLAIPPSLRLLRMEPPQDWSGDPGLASTHAIRLCAPLSAAAPVKGLLESLVSMPLPLYVTLHSLGINSSMPSGSAPRCHPLQYQSRGLVSHCHQAQRPAATIRCNISQGIPIMWTTDMGPPPPLVGAAGLSPAPAVPSGTTLLAARGAAAAAHLTWKKVPGWPTPMKRVEMTPGQAWARSVCSTQAVHGSTERVRIR